MKPALQQVARFNEEAEQFCGKAIQKIHQAGFKYYSIADDPKKLLKNIAF
jgi:hypothetical protein